MSEVVTDFVKKYVAEHGMLPATVDRPDDSEPTQPNPASTAKAKRDKGSKEAS